MATVFVFLLLVSLLNEVNTAQKAKSIICNFTSPKIENDCRLGSVSAPITGKTCTKFRSGEIFF